MRNLLARASAITAALVVLFAAEGCQTGGAGNSTGSAGLSAGNAEQEVTALLVQYRQALLNNDAATLERIWADDLTFVNFRGDLVTKQQRMENFKTGATGFKSIKVADLKVRAYGQTAVATEHTTIEAQYSGQEGSGSYRVTTVWAKPKGTWQLVAVHTTRIAS